MSRETSESVASIAARWLGMDDRAMNEYVGYQLGPKMFAEIRAMAASCLAQAEPDPLAEEKRRGAIPWTDLKSTNLKRSRFDPVTGELEVDFHTGASWTYRDVPANVAAELAIAESPGGYFHKNIRGKYEGAGTKAQPPASTGKEELRRSVEE